MKYLVTEIDKKTSEQSAIATRCDWHRACNEVSEIRRGRSMKMNRRFAHEIKLIRGDEI